MSPNAHLFKVPTCPPSLNFRTFYHRNFALVVGCCSDPKGWPNSARVSGRNVIFGKHTSHGSEVFHAKLWASRELVLTTVPGTMYYYVCYLLSPAGAHDVLLSFIMFFLQLIIILILCWLSFNILVTSFSLTNNWKKLFQNIQTH